jgi:hypothetical protein
MKSFRQFHEQIQDANVDGTNSNKPAIASSGEINQDLLNLKPALKTELFRFLKKLESTAMSSVEAKTFLDLLNREVVRLTPISDQQAGLTVRKIF